MKHIRHTSVTVQQYLRDQITKTRAETQVTFWGSDPANYHNVSYDPDMCMDMNHNTVMNQRNNGTHIENNGNEKMHSMNTKHDNAWVNILNVPKVGNQTETKNRDMP